MGFAPVLGLIAISLSFLFPQPAAAEKVVLQLRWDHQFQFAGYYAAQWKGFYKAAGLDVEIRGALKGPRQIIKAVDEVAAGRAQFGVGAVDVLLAADKGIPVSIVSSIFQESAVRFFYRADTPIHSPAEFANHRVARRIGDSTDIEFMAMMIAEGINPDAVQPYPFDVSRGFLGALVNGDIDVISGYSIGTPFEAGRAPIEIRSLAPASFGVNFYGDALFVDRSLAESDPDLVERFRDACLKGWQYALEYPEEIADRIISEFEPMFPISDFPAFVKFQVEPTRHLTLYPTVGVGQTNPDRWRRMHEYLLKAGLVTKSFEPRTFLFNPQEVRIEKTRFLLQLSAIGLGVVVVFGVVLWIYLLRRSIDRKTREISTTDETLSFIAQRGWEKMGAPFFESLVKFLGTTLNVDYAFVDILLADGRTVRTVALYAMGTFPENIEYELEWTPCHNVIGKNLCCYPERVIELFPKDDLLVEMGAESYAGIPLWDSNRNAIGLVAVMDRKPLKDPERVKTVLQLIAVRAAHELERMQTEESLVAARTQAENANRAKSEFLANISHDLRTPLNSILGFADLMRERTFGGLGDRHYDEYVDYIHNSGDRLLSLVNDILDLSKIESREYKLDEEWIDVKAELEASFLRCSPAAVGEPTLRISIDVDDVAPQLFADKRAVTQIIDNLVSNAIKYAGADARITVSWNRSAEGGGVLQVNDDGNGISADHLEMITQPFVRGDEEYDSNPYLSRQHDGFGLGLHIVSLLVELHGGRFEIDSVEGEGTTASVSFPEGRLRAPADDGSETGNQRAEI